MEDIIEDIIGMDPSFKEEGTDSPLLMQRTVSVSRRSVRLKSVIAPDDKKRNFI